MVYPASCARLHVPAVRRRDSRRPQRPSEGEWQSFGEDGERLHLVFVKRLFNEVLARKPAGMAPVTVHLCRGNYRSAWAAEGSYDFVGEALFSELAVDGFFLEYDDARSGGFEPLRFVPKGPMVVLGLVTTKRGALESKDELKRRIEAAARFVPLDQLCLSPQCGFASVMEGNELSPTRSRLRSSASWSRRRRRCGARDGDNGRAPLARRSRAGVPDAHRRRMVG